MTLLKGDGTLPEKIYKENIGLGIKDGWGFGIGFGLAMTIAVPFILLLFGCIIWVGLIIFGSSLGVIWP
jgi:hypothetical protein